MKTLLILRHAKSSWEDARLDDFQRPLIEKGRKRAMLIAQFLSEKKIFPEAVVSSPAVRALDTAEIICSSLGFPLNGIVKDNGLYFVNNEKYFEAIFALPDTSDTAMLVGHNPMITDIVNSFLFQPIDNLPTSGLLVVELECNSWRQVLTAEKNVLHLVFPKSLERQ